MAAQFWKILEVSLTVTMRKSRTLRGASSFDAFWYGRFTSLREESLKEARQAVGHTLRRTYARNARSFNCAALGCLRTIRAAQGEMLL